MRTHSPNQYHFTAIFPNAAKCFSCLTDVIVFIDFAPKGVSIVRDRLPQQISVWYQDWFLVDRLYARWAQQYDLTYASLFALYALYKTGGCTPSYLAEFLSVSKQTVNSFLKSLESRKIIVREPSQLDRRSCLITLTEDGGKWTAQLMQRLAQMEERAFRCLTPEEIKTMGDINHRLAAGIQKEVQEDMRDV